MAINFENLVLFVVFVYFMRMLKQKNQEPVDPPPTSPLPPPSIVGQQNPFQQNPSAPGGGVTIGGKPITTVPLNREKYDDPIASSFNYLFPFASNDLKLAYLDTLDRTVRGDYTSKAQIKQNFINDYKYLTQADWNEYYKDNPQLWVSQFQPRYSSFMNKVTTFFLGN